MLHGCRQFLFYNVWLIPIKDETLIFSCYVLKQNFKKITFDKNDERK